MSRILLLLLAVFLVSTAGLFAHRALAETTPLALAAWRLGLAALFFLAWRTLDRREPAAAPLGRRIWARLFLAGVCLAVHFLLWFAALQYTLIARATLLVCTTPFWATLAGMVLYRRPVKPIYWLALGIAGGGVFLVTQTGTEHGARHGQIVGDLLALGGGLVFALYLLSVEGLHEAISSRRQVTVAYTVAALVLWLGLLLHGGATLQYSPGVWSAIAGMSIGPQIFGHTLLNASLRHFPASVVAFSILLEPVIAAVLAYMLFHQAITAGQTVGGLLVLIGLALVIARQSPLAMAEDL